MNEIFIKDLQYLIGKKTNEAGNQNSNSGY